MLSSRYFSSQNELQAASVNRSTLKRGSRGEAVRRLQVSLSAIGHQMPRSELSNGGFDGIFGTETSDRITTLQRARSLSVDGIAGRQVLSSLDRDMMELERVLSRLELTVIGIFGFFDYRFASGVSISPEELAVSTDVKTVDRLSGTISRLQPVLARVGQEETGNLPRPLARNSGMTDPTGSVQFVAAPAAVAFPVVAVVAALEQAMVALFALMAVVVIAWALSVTIPIVWEKIKELSIAAMAELSAAITALQEIVNESLEAFVHCGPLLVELLKVLKFIALRGASTHAVRWVRPNAGVLKSVPNKDVLEGMRKKLTEAADILERLVACLAKNGLMGSDAFRKLDKWMREFRELSAKLGKYEEPIGKLW